jgi:hypothetical protein
MKTGMTLTWSTVSRRFGRGWTEGRTDAITVDNIPFDPNASLRPARLRMIGLFVLVFGMAGACLFYWIETRSATPTVAELIPGSAEAQARQIGILMGPFGLMLSGWVNVLERPGTEAIIIAAVSALVALGYFRAARLRSDGP